MECSCCHSALKESLRGICLLAAIGGLSAVLFGVHALLPLGPSASDFSVAWFGYLLAVIGGILFILGIAATGLSAALHCFNGATLVLLPLEALLVWAYVAHPSQLRWLADRDQTYALTSILDWVDGHAHLAAGLAALWLLLQATAVLLGSIHACCPTSRRYKHPWDRYWLGEDDLRESLLPQTRVEVGEPTGYHTPPSRLQTPYTSPARQPVPSTPIMPRPVA